MVPPVAAASADRLVREQLAINETGQLELAAGNVTADFVNHRAATEPPAAGGQGPAAAVLLGTRSRGNVCRAHPENASRARLQSSHLAVSRALAMRNQGQPFPQEPGRRSDGAACPLAVRPVNKG